MKASHTLSETLPGDQPRLEELTAGCYSFSADGCNNTGVVVGERGMLVVDAQATPELSASALETIRGVSDKPVKVLVLTHFHADSSGGASAFDPGEIIASDLTQRLLITRGADDGKVLKHRFQDLFESTDADPVAPSMTIASSMTIDLGGVEVRLMHLGRGHTMGDLVVWVPSRGVLFAGGLVHSGVSPYCGDAHLADWPRALDRILAFRPTVLVPGYGRIARGVGEVAAAVETTRSFVTTLRDAAAACAESNFGLKDTYRAIGDVLAPEFGALADFETHLPYNTARAYDEAHGLDQPQAWTLERSADLQDALAEQSAAGSQKGGPDNVIVMEPASNEPDADDIQNLAEVDDTAPEGHGVAADDEAEGEDQNQASPELVSDIDFAASLIADDGLSEPSQEDVLVLDDADTVDEAALEDVRA